MLRTLKGGLTTATLTLALACGTPTKALETAPSASPQAAKQSDGPLSAPSTAVGDISASGYRWLMRFGREAGYLGYGVADAGTDPSDPRDAYDGAFLLIVDRVSFFTDAQGTIDLTGTTVTTDPVVMSGLSVSGQYAFLTTAPAVRTLYTFTNPTGAPITVTVEIATNVGSDAATRIEATSSGDTIVTDADRYLISSDGGPVDLVNSFVRFGSGAALTPTSPRLLVDGAEDFIDGYSLTVPAGQTRRLMTFGRVTQTIPQAAAAIGAFDTTASMDAAGYLAGMTTQERAEVVNFDLVAAPPTPVPTLSEWAMILFGMLLAGGAALVVQRRRLVG